MPTHPAVCHRCSVSHQYSAEMLWRPNLETADFAFIDLYDYSCLNGWAMGNIAASARDLSMFFRDLFSPTPHAPGAKPMLSPQSRDLMTDPKKMHMLSNSWWAGHTNDTYSLGNMRILDFRPLVIPGTGDASDTDLWGHPGSDWGSGSSPLCGYNIKYGFGICMNAAQTQSMQCAVHTLYPPGAALPGPAGFVDFSFLATDLAGVVSNMHVVRWCMMLSRFGCCPSRSP